MRLLKNRAIINGSQITELNPGELLLINLTTTSTSIVISNGFHLSRNLELIYDPGKIYFYHIDCIIDNIKLFYGIFISLVLFGMYILTSAIGFIIFANLPIIYMLYLFYVERNSFIQLNAVWKI